MNFSHHDGDCNSLANYKISIELKNNKVDDKLINFLYFIIKIKNNTDLHYLNKYNTKIK